MAAALGQVVDAVDDGGAVLGPADGEPAALVQQPGFVGGHILDKKFIHQIPVEQEEIALWTGVEGNCSIHKLYGTRSLVWVPLWLWVPPWKWGQPWAWGPQ